MSRSIASDYGYDAFDALALPAAGPLPVEEPAVTYKPRPRWIPWSLALPTCLAGISWLAGGVQVLIDASFVVLTAICIVALLIELRDFPRRFGIGGVVLYGGTLIWFSHDYFSNWFGGNDRTHIFTTATLAKGAFLLGLLVMMASAGMLIQRGKWIVRAAGAIPEAGSPYFYGFLLAFLFLVGISPYFLFVVEPPHVAILKDMTGMRTAGRATFTVWRDGNLNYSWGGYVAQLLDVGQFSGLLGAFFAVMIARSRMGRALGWGAWLFWTLMAFGTGSRGPVLAAALPAIGLLYIKHQARAAEFFRRFSLRAYVVAIALGLVIVVAVQIQGSFRNTRFERADWSSVKVGQLQGNHMYSEGLLSLQLVPEEVPHFRRPFPGSGAVLVVPDLVVGFVIYPIPRALWTSKPVDAGWQWYNTAFSQRFKTGSATIAAGLHAGVYVRYGIEGHIVFALLFGWLLVSSERILLNSATTDKPFQVLVALAMAVWLFRAFRGGLGAVELYAVLVGMGLMVIVTAATRPFFGGGARAQG